jgi:hypothetical protein
VFNVDTDIDHTTAFATGTRRFGNKPASGHPKSKFLPRDEWNKMTQTEKDKFIAKRRQERISSSGSTSKPLQSLGQANVHEVEDVISFDDIVDYFVMQHDVTSQDDVTNVKGDEALSNNALLAYMAGRNTGASPGDIRHVLASNQTPTSSKETSRKVNASSSAPSTVQVGDTTYYLNKGETISV